MHSSSPKENIRLRKCGVADDNIKMHFKKNRVSGCGMGCSSASVWVPVISGTITDVEFLDQLSDYQLT
jgi:hypothetical protein